MRSGCKRVALRVKERSHEHVSGSEKWGCVVGVASDDRRDCMAVMDHEALGVMWSGEVPSVSCVRGLSICGGDNFSCWGYFLVGYWRWL